MNGPILTPAVLSKLPLGLLGFFGIKNGGKYPQYIVPEIQPTLELADILAVNYNEMVAIPCLAALGFVTGNILATGLPAVVPASEVWFVSSLTVLTFTGVGDSMTGTVEVRNTQTGSASAWHRALTMEFTQAASLTKLHPSVMTDGFWAQPGDTFGTHFSAFVNASGTATASIQAKFTRFPF